MAPDEVEALRALTPGCAEGIHFNNAGSALPTQAVLDTQIDYLRFEATIGGYEAAHQERDRIAATYASCAGLIGAEAHQVALVENATAAWMMAFHSLRLSLPLGPGDQIITSEADYGANFIAYLQAAGHYGIEVVLAPNDESGAVDPTGLAALITDRTKLISITHTPTNGGLVNPAEAIGAVARAAGVPFLLDACQTVGQLPLDVTKIGCDFLSATGRKYLRGPRGTGFLFASDAMLDRIEPAVLDHHGATWSSLDAYTIRPDARRFENWEFNYASVLGLGTAADEAVAIGLDRIEARVTSLADRLRSGLASIGVTTRDLGTRRCGIVTATVDDVAAVEVKRLLADRGISVSVAPPASTLHDAVRRSLPDLVRLSVHYYNTEFEVDETIGAIGEI